MPDESPAETPKPSKMTVSDGNGGHREAAPWEIEQEVLRYRRKMKKCTEKCAEHKQWCKKACNHVGSHYCDHCFPGE